MSRRRYVSSDISIDRRVNRLAEESDFAALLYTWMIPHAGDDGTLTGDPEELLFTVLPGRRSKTTEDVAEALAAMERLELIEWDRARGRIGFPVEAFYKYQTYIQPPRRRAAPIGNGGAAPPQDAAEQRKTAQDAADRRAAPPIAASVKPSPSFKPSFKPSPPGSPGPGEETQTAIGGSGGRARAREGAGAPCPTGPPAPAESVAEGGEASANGGARKKPPDRGTPAGYELVAFHLALTRAALKDDGRRRAALHADALLTKCRGSLTEAKEYVEARYRNGDSPDLAFCARDYSEHWREKMARIARARASPGGKDVGLTDAEIQEWGRTGVMP